MVYADNDIVVVCKPAGLLSVPGRFLKDSVLQRLLYEYPDARVVHRLDLDTSGLMALALTKLATSDLNRQFRERTIQKQYEADVWGEVEASKGEVDLPIRPDPHDRPRQVVDHQFGKKALTLFKRERVSDSRTRLLLKPITGRSHQLRLHMASMGHPILGCDLYAHDKAFQASNRLCLHASEIEFAHPVSGDAMRFKSKCPF